MHKDWVLYHLEEAADALQKLISDASSDPEYGEEELAVDMQHLYHHINTAWNARNTVPTDVEPGTDRLFNEWSKFPSDLEMMSL